MNNKLFKVHLLAALIFASIVTFSSIGRQLYLDAKCQANPNAPCDNGYNCFNGTNYPCTYCDAHTTDHKDCLSEGGEGLWCVVVDPIAGGCGCRISALCAPNNTCTVNPSCGSEDCDQRNCAP